MNFRRVGLIITGIIIVGLVLLNRQDVTVARQTDFELDRISASGYELKSVIVLQNPNVLSSTIQTIHEKIMVDETVLAELNLELQQGIPGRKETRFPVSIRIAADSLNEFVSVDEMGMIEKLPIKIVGDISFSNLTGSGKASILQYDSIPVFAR